MTGLFVWSSLEGCDSWIHAFFPVHRALRCLASHIPIPSITSCMSLRFSLLLAPQHCGSYIKIIHGYDWAESVLNMWNNSANFFKNFHQAKNFKHKFSEVLLWYRTLPQFAITVFNNEGDELLQNAYWIASNFTQSLQRFVAFVEHLWSAESCLQALQILGPFEKSKVSIALMLVNGSCQLLD